MHNGTEEEYCIKWEINLSAKSFKDAAKQALKIHRNPESIATYFIVKRWSDGKQKGVDLN